VASLGRPASRDVVACALTVLRRLAHRGAVGADPLSGDGAGILLQVPDALLRRCLSLRRVELPKPGRYAVAMLFLPRHGPDRIAAERVVGSACARHGLRPLAWRDVPCRPAAAGPVARGGRPEVRQLLAASGGGQAEGRCYLARKTIEAELAALDFAHPASHQQFHVASLSTRTIVYKGQLTPHQLAAFYPDLRADDCRSQLALVHQRFSTNTEPSWRLAQPFRLAAHNGEINTLRGNVNWMRAREAGFARLVAGAAPAAGPVIEPGGSDSLAFDNTLELLLRTGRPLPDALCTMVPEAWEQDRELPCAVRDFYHHQARLLEPWDGPAAIVASDGRQVAAILDRNGLRPARYVVTADGLVVLASEAGVLEVDAGRVVQLGRLHPGGTLVVDPGRGQVILDGEVKRRVARRHAYGKALADHSARCPTLPTMATGSAPSLAQLTPRHHLFGYSEEELETVIASAAATGHEAVASMGNDLALAVLARSPRLVYDYVAQGFAQVTNPAIDPIRERRVMSWAMELGGGGDLLDPRPQAIDRIRLERPVLTAGELEWIRSARPLGLAARTLAAVFPSTQGPAGLERALTRLCDEADVAAADGIAIVVLSDVTADRRLAPVPMLLAIGAVHHHLVRQGTRSALSLVVESDEPRSVHHLACLLGQGAEAVHPRLALETAAALADAGAYGLSTPPAAVQRLRSALTEGVGKVMSKMGISTLAGYCGAQVMEVVGISAEVVSRCWPGTPARLAGADLAVLAEETLARHRATYDPADRGGADPLGSIHRWRVEGEPHGWAAATVAALQHAVRTSDDRHFQAYCRLADRVDQPPVSLRHLIEPIAGDPIPIEAVEPAELIVRRFATGAMSLGSLSPEAHETLAVAMNRLGARSNTGEGGEDPERFHPSGDGDSRRSAVKQVASARFGVTVEYLVSADDLQIKIAQGAKPGEGGQLPGHKVDEAIARVRRSAPGVELISPPPHHDIYSIEDLAQLIWDLKQANPVARISVKLVAAAGVGTVAAGVVKARADHILIAGHDGGTGAAPLSSIKHVGVPWELGLAETQQTLVRQGLRDRVSLQTDGGLKTGRDVVVAALLGAEEFGFATSALVASGCVLMRVCHLNTCPVGVATQDPVLRRRFSGTPDQVVRFFMLLAADVRAWMARLGFATIAEMVGRVDRLRPREGPRPWKARDLDLSALLHMSQPAPSLARTLGDRGGMRRRTRDQQHHLETALDVRVWGRARPALEEGRVTTIRARVRNHERAVGGRLSGAIARRYGGAGLPDDTLRLMLRGVAGQSLGAWLAPGITLVCTGAANDYAGKGLSGGRLVVRAPRAAAYSAEDNVIVGNVVLYGATSGEAFFGGQAGERFGVRNSGATAVVEGIGDHGCEYMTGGTVVVLGSVGRNFGAGMTGGVAYVLDHHRSPRLRLNRESVVESGVEPVEAATLHALLQRHRRHTGSRLAAGWLRDWPAATARLRAVRPVARAMAAEHPPAVPAELEVA